MELTCKQCGSKFRAAIQLPLKGPVRVVCPSCRNQMVIKPASGAHQAVTPAQAQQGRKRIAAITDEPRPFRHFLGEHLRRLGFEVVYFETGDPALEFIRRTRADLLIVNVYLRGKLGVEVTEEIKADPDLKHTRVILIGALFRANRFRANPTNLYGADEYIEEQIPEKEFRHILHRLFPDIADTSEIPLEPREFDEARRLARLILS
ncbi:MAG TPA: response regulator, partial [Thermoanaerobaculia bacterium]|nr:response regulator [Thermoanaerobaculia bacterium]